MFYKCYNEDAMLFTQRVKVYKVSSKFVKSVGTQVLSIGFPLSVVNNGQVTLDSLCKKNDAIKYDIKQDRVAFYLKDTIKQDYIIWQESVLEKKDAQTVKEPAQLAYAQSKEFLMDVISLIKNFDLANSTPMEGLNFIQQLKIEVQRTDSNRNGNI